MSRFADQQREVIAGLADILIPEAEGMPSASAAGVAGEALDEIANVRSDIVGDLLRVVRLAEGREPAEFVRWLHSSDPEGFAALALAVAGGYYTRPNVRQALGYSGPARAPIDVSQTPDFLAQSLLQPVIGRGEIWRSP